VKACRQDPPVVHRAGWVVADPWHIYQAGYVHIEKGVIKSIGTGRIPEGIPVMDHGPGALAAGLVNAHTHLELGALCGKLPFDREFEHWVSALLQQRAGLTTEEMTAGMLRGIAELRESGCAVVGEISTLGASREILLSSGLAGVWFEEFLGNSIPPAPSRREASDTLRNALAGHAPHTSAPDLLKTLKARTRQNERPFSIHVSESDAEMEFITAGKGAWADFLSRRGIDFSDWGLPASSPVFHLDRLGILDENTLAVHLLHAQKKDFDLLAERGGAVCICPRSNENLHGRLPDLSGMIRAGLRICLGTDSLASVSSLNLREEIKLVATRFPGIFPAQIWAMATVNGAAALGLSTLFGTLQPGHVPAMLYVPVDTPRPSAVLEKMVFGEMENRNFE
jgi:cytosine/adenosine deaminase-related metal-dependent hydrolase